MRIEKNFEFTVADIEKKTRVDAFLASQIEGLSRSALTGPLCEIYINDELCKKSDIVKNGDTVTLNFVQDVFDKVVAQDIPLDVLYEDSSMIVINKAQGMVVHPGAGNVDGTIVNALAYRYGQGFIDSMADECDVTRPGIVHRLDKDTSGVMVIALTAQAHANLSAQFQNREIQKYYYAMVDGVVSKHEGDVECLLCRDKNDRKLFAVSKTPMGKPSKSHYVVEHQYPQAALVKVRIYTGRTHQIRIHMKSIGNPVIGDVLYNNKNRFKDQSLMLHSYSLEIKHPVTGELMKFVSPIPERFSKFAETLK